MIYHVNRARMKASAAPEQIEAALESWRVQVRTIPAVRSGTVGRDHGGEFEYGAMFAVEDLDGLFEHLTLVDPAIFETDRIGLGLVERLHIFDIVEDDDPEMGAKIEELHRRRNELNPEVAGALADVPDCLGAGREN